MPMPSFKDVAKEQVEDLTNNFKRPARGILLSIYDPVPSFKDVAKKEVEDSTNNSKRLALGIGSIKPITLNVSPGDKVPLEYIMLSEPEPSVAKVFEEKFRDKYVCIFMLPINSRHMESSFLDAMILSDVYNHIQSSGGKFEVICVPTHSQAELNERNEYFNPYPHHFDIESCTPFSHIDIDDNECLDRIARTIGLPEETTCVIVGPMKGRRVVSIFDSDFLNWHGAEAYPFTAKKIQQLAREDEALLNAKSDLKTLLSTPCRDFVISNDCTKVPISDLQQKTVCLLFYEDNWECKKRTEELKQVYEAHKNFEVVVVFAINFGHDTSHLVGTCLNFRSELKFWKVFCDMPWLAVPFDDPKCRQLWRIFNRTKICNDSYAPKLIIIHSEGKYFEENGFQVLEKTRFINYPFMGKEVVRTAVRGKKLSSVLGRDVELLRNEVIYGSGWQYSNEGQEICTVSEPCGASVVLFFIGVPGFSEFLRELGNYHSASCRTTMSSFEVVYIPMMESSPSACSWMLDPYPELIEGSLIPLFTHFFEDKITQNPEKRFTLALVTYGPFGHYFERGIIFTTSSEDAYQLFLKTFPFSNNENKDFFKSLCK